MDHHFKNPYEDYKDGEVSVDENWLRALIIDYVTIIISNVDLNQGHEIGILYAGNAGIAYMFLKLHQSQFDFRILHPLFHAQRFINDAEANIIDPTNFNYELYKSCSLLHGNAGIHCLSTKISSVRNNLKEMRAELMAFRSGYETCRKMEFCEYGSDGMLVGRAGYLSGIYWLNKNITPKPFQDQEITELCQVMIDSCRKYSEEKGSTFPLLYRYYTTDNLGALNGLCSILHMLLESPWFQREGDSFNYSNIPKSNLEDIKKTIDAFVALQDDDGSFPCETEDIGRPMGNCRVQWCNGAPGAIYLLIKSYLIFKEEKYLNSCRKVADLVWQYGLLKRNPGLCHGVAANGYVFLMMYRLTGEPKYLYRATKFAKFLQDPEFVKKTQNLEFAYSLYEGLAGTVCFLVDLLDPLKSYFPFMEVF